MQAALVATLAAVTIAATGRVACADNVQNDVNVASGDNRIPVGGSTTIGSRIQATGNHRNANASSSTRPVNVSNK